MSTIYALSSGRPPAAIAIIRISGPLAQLAAARLCSTLPEPRSAAVRPLHHPESGELLDEALVLRFDAPSTATGEDLVEFHCHGGRAVVDAVLGALRSLEGLREAQPGEFTRRALENGRIDLTEAEGLADLLEAETESQRKAALALADGGLRKQIGSWQERLLTLSAAAERAIDYDDEDESVDASLLTRCAALADDLGQWLERPRIEPLKAGIKVVVAGPPNTGKSRLLNAIAGFDRAIVSDVAGTTRDHIDVPLSLNGVPIVLTDTAGLREADDSIEAAGVTRAQGLIDQADVLLWLGDHDDMPPHSRALLVHSKADLGGTVASEAISVSALTGDGVPNLLDAVERAARTLLPGEDGVALNRRQAMEIGTASEALRGAANANEAVIVAEELRAARAAFDRLTGRAGMEEVLDALFSRFCLGK
jgi:tRNA modification GTPase